MLKSILYAFRRVILLAVSLALALPEIRGWVGLESKQNQVAIAVFIILVIIVVEFFLHFTRQNKYNRIEENKDKFLELMTMQFISAYKKEYSYQLRINIMMLKRRLFVGKKYFKIVWGSEKMKFSRDSDLVLYRKQGVCAQAADVGAVVAADLTVNSGVDFGLSPEQIEKTSLLKFVISCPIKKMGKKSKNQFILTNKVLGTVNIDSCDEGSEFLLNNESTRNDLTERIERLSETCSYLY